MCIYKKHHFLVYVYASDTLNVYVCTSLLVNIVDVNCVFFLYCVLTYVDLLR